MSFSIGSKAEAWTSWSTSKRDKRSRAQSSSCCWDHAAGLPYAWARIWGCGRSCGSELVCSKGVWDSLCISRLACSWLSIFIQPFLNTVCLSAWERANRKYRGEGYIRGETNLTNLQKKKKRNIDSPSFGGTVQPGPCRSSRETPCTNFTRCLLSCSWVSTSNCSTACWERAKGFILLLILLRMLSNL